MKQRDSVLSAGEILRPVACLRPVITFPIVLICLTRKEKIVTYKDSLQFPMTGWSDVTDWPPLDSLASQGLCIVGVSLEKQVEAADKETRAAFDKFRNQFVQQNCHRDVEIRTWDTLDIPDMGPNQSIFICTSSKRQTPFILSIGCFLALGATCLSCPLRTYLRSRTKLYTVKVSKGNIS